MTATPDPPPAAALPAFVLREPAHRVSESAPAFWRLVAGVGAAVAWLIAVVVAIVAALFAEGWWAVALWAGVAVLVILPIPSLTVAPRIRYDVHRWEVTDIAIHVRHGWLTRTDEIVPLSRVQTVDSVQGPLMRLFKLRTVTVKTASSAGAVQIAFLDEPVAHALTERLVAITSATPEDAT